MTTNDDHTPESERTGETFSETDQRPTEPSDCCYVSDGGCVCDCRVCIALRRVEGARRTNARRAEAAEARVARAEAAIRLLGNEHITPQDADLLAELERLRRWKAEASEVILGLQDVGKALGLRLGERITGTTATEAAKQLSARAEAAERALAAERAKVARVEAEAAWLDASHDDSLVTSDYPMIARRIRAALAEPEATEGACVCAPDGPCLGVPGDTDECPACLALDPELGCLAAPEGCICGDTYGPEDCPVHDSDTIKGCDSDEVAERVERYGDAIYDAAVDHPMWIGDDGEPLDYNPDREARLGDFINESTRAVMAVADAEQAAVRAESDEWKRAARRLPYAQSKLTRLATLTPDEMTRLVKASLQANQNQKVEEAIVGVIADLLADDAGEGVVAPRCPSLDPWGGGLQCSRERHDDDGCQFEGIAWKKALHDGPIRDWPTEGCSCTELCSMGPTCPGGSLAGLAGSGCWRTKPDPAEDGGSSPTCPGDERPTS